jgi:hypothetical protein
VSVVLQACFGGVASRFHVKLLRDRTFLFSVASRSVGFHTYNIGKFLDKDFEFSINLLSEGGPNWKFEEAKFYIEQDKEWTQVKNKKSLRTSVFKRLSFSASNSNKYLVPVSKVFDRINSSTITTAPNAANKLPINNNGHSFGRVGISDKINSEFIWVPKRSHHDQSGAKLPGILLFMKFAPFPKVDWHNDSNQSWFKARGSAIQIKKVSCLKDLGQSFFGAKNKLCLLVFIPYCATYRAYRLNHFPFLLVGGGFHSNGEHPDRSKAVHAEGL